MRNGTGRESTGQTPSDRDANGAEPAAGAAGVLGVVLAGGLSSRMGREKAFVSLQGRPLLAHVLERLAPQVGRVVVNANGDAGRFGPFGLAVVPDGPAGPAGPLAGIVAGLSFACDAGFPLVATCPADAPFLPRDVVARLRGALGDHGAACLARDGMLEPLFGLWRTESLATVEDLFAAGTRAVREALSAVGYAEVEAEPGDDLANLNTPGDLAEAEAGRKPTPGASST